MSCNKCGQVNCVCGASVLANVQLIDSLFDNPTINGGTQNSPTLNDATINGGTLDCNVTGCTAGPGQCNDGVATNAFVCAEVERQIDGSNPDFCQAVDDCLTANPSALCATIAACINGTPGIINNTIAFGISARATTALYGVVRYATQSQFAQANCLLAVDPCTLRDFWNTPNLASPMWAAFQNAVDLASTAVLNNAILTGDPQAPTPPPGDNDNSIATTAFVTTAITNAISAGNPAFCAAVLACGAGGLTCAAVTALFPAAGGNPGAGVGFLGNDCMSYTAAQIVAAGGGGSGASAIKCSGGFNFNQGPDVLNWSATPVYSTGCTIVGFVNSGATDVTVNITTALANPNYTVAVSFSGAGTAGNPTSFSIISQGNSQFVIRLPQVTAFSGIRVDFAVLQQ